MRILQDMLSGIKPVPKDMIYNGSLAADCVTARYKGSVAKFMNFDDLDHGTFVTFGGLATIGERVCGLLEEDVGITGNYLPDSTTYGPVYKKIAPCFVSTLVEAEYARADRAGTDNYDTNYSGTTTAITCGDGITTADVLIGGWLYFLNGPAANQLHYITDNDNGGIITVATSVAAAVVAADDLLVILPPHVNKCLFDATYTGILSECDDNLWTHPIQGLSTWISAPGIPKQKLSRDLHDGLSIANARFYHQFTFSGCIDDNAATIPNAWCGSNR